MTHQRKDEFVIDETELRARSGHKTLPRDSDVKRILKIRSCLFWSLRSTILSFPNADVVKKSSSFVWSTTFFAVSATNLRQDLVRLQAGQVLQRTKVHEKETCALFISLIQNLYYPVPPGNEFQDKSEEKILVAF